MEDLRTQNRKKKRTKENAAIFVYVSTNGHTFCLSWIYFYWLNYFISNVYLYIKSNKHE